MPGLIADFHPGVVKRFTIECQIDGVAQDIRSDTVTVTIKDDRSKPDTQALLKVTGDVTTQGANGIAIFNLTAAQTKVIPGHHYIDIKWERGSDEYVIYDERIKVLKRVSDA